MQVKGDNLPTAAVGDVHGRLDILKPLVSSLVNTYGPLKLVMLGDYIDRRPDSAGVIDFLMSPPEEVELIALMGNHEAMMLAALEGTFPMRSWLMNGGDEALASYDRHPEYRGDVPQHHLDWMRSLPLYHDDGERLFVHAGVHPDYAWEDQDPDHLLWIRGDFLQRPH